MINEVDRAVRWLKEIGDERDKRYEQRFRAQEEAVRVATNAHEKRLDGMNEFRETLRDQATTFMPRAEAELQFKSIVDKIDLLVGSDARRVGRSAGFESTRVMFFAIVSTIIGVIGIGLAIYANLHH